MYWKTVMKLSNINRYFIAVILILLLASCTATVPPSVNLRYGNPSKANRDRLNYLIEKPEYALSYNCEAGIANWVSWELDRSWLGTAERSDDFRPDSELPTDCYAVRPNDYRGSGYDRGHLVPSGDRTNSSQDNSSTFIMTNMIPQSPSNNREVWRELEEYSRRLAFQGKKLYLVAGGYGIARKIANSQVIVPASTWKVILILDRANGEITEDNADTIAVWIPNSEEVRNTDWRDYIVSVDEVEQKTGYNFFARLPKKVQHEIESVIYN